MACSENDVECAFIHLGQSIGLWNLVLCITFCYQTIFFETEPIEVSSEAFFEESRNMCFSFTANVKDGSYWSIYFSSLQEYTKSIHAWSIAIGSSDDKIPISFIHGSSASLQQSQSIDILHIMFI